MGLTGLLNVQVSLWCVQTTKIVTTDKFCLLDNTLGMLGTCLLAYFLMLSALLFPGSCIIKYRDFDSTGFLPQLGYKKP